MEKFLYQDLYNLEDKHWWHKNKLEIINTFIKSYSPKKKLKILDLGCGTGKVIDDLKKFGDVWGVDNSKEAITFCKKRGLKNVYQRNSDSTKLPNNFFDLVLVLDVLEHTDDTKTLLETNRVLKKQGLLMISVPAFPWLWSQWDKIHHHQRRYTIKSLSQKLSVNNFKIEKISYVYSFLVLPILIIRLLKTSFRKETYSSDFQITIPVINSFFYFLCNIERLFMRYKKMPIGSSIFCVARKN